MIMDINAFSLVIVWKLLALVKMIASSKALDIKVYILWILLLKEQICLLACSLNHLWVGYGIEDLVMLA